MEGTGRWESHVWRHGKSPMSSGRGLSRCCRQHREGTRSSNTRGRRERVASARIRGSYSRRSCTFCARAANGRRCRRSASVVPARSINAFSNGQRLAFSCDSGRRAWPSMTRWRASLGDGKASTGPWSRHHLLKNLSDPTRRIGGRNGSKRMLLVDERGAPLSIIVTGANRHDVTQLASTLVSGGVNFVEIGRFENRAEITGWPWCASPGRNPVDLLRHASHRPVMAHVTSFLERFAMMRKKISEIEGGEEDPRRNAGFRTGQFARLSERR